ncbi:MAG: HDIG domain-containing protein [Candidatus Omnitrophica bacterium]|nr:HDIG domain-containing protein [Candidatus Omnitrophota bacterium]
MIRQVAKNKLLEIFWSVMLFAGAFVCQINLVVPLSLLIIFVYIRLRGVHVRHCSLPNMFLLYLMMVATGDFVLRQGWPVFYIPFILVPVLTMVLFNNLEVTFLITLAGSLSIGAFSGSPYELTMISFIGGVTASFLCHNARNRNVIIRAGFLAGLTQVIALIFIEAPLMARPERYLVFIGNSIASSIVVLGVLPVFEYLFKVVTNISLLELADFNHPLMQRMILEAPGTYHHSLVVGNLAEGACAAINANSLLARIGAYYHDIGKIDKAEYFSENQSLQESKHDNLAPSMSKLVIMNHVKEGIELARKYRLNTSLREFILRHHGNSLVYYFYRRALQTSEEDEVVSEEGFRYPGPKPNTKETAVVLLADSVEAATRALKEPTAEKIRELVHKIVNNKFIDGQLDECDLTLKDLNRISQVFCRLLNGIYHSRVSYPEEHKKDEKAANGDQDRG